MVIGIDIRLIGKKRTGDEVVFFNLVKELARINTDHKFKLFTDITDKNTLLEISEQLGIAGKENFEIISLQTSNRFAWNFWTLPTYLRKNPVDIYHTQYITPWNVSREIKIVTIIHDISFNFFSQFIKFSDLFFLKTLIPMSIRRADKIVAVSAFTKNEIVDFYKTDPDKVAVVYNSVAEDWKSEEISSEKLAEVRKKYSLPEKFILYIGTLQPRKNLPMLIEAFAKIKTNALGTKLVICGNQKAHNYDLRIDEAVKKNNVENDVVFPGFVDENDKAAIFRLASVFAFPTFYEGFGIPLLEAMSQKIPVICSDIPSLKEIGSDGALYFDPASLDDFSKKLYDICVDNDLRNELIQKGTERVSFFSWKKSAEQTLALYVGLLDNSKKQ